MNLSDCCSTTASVAGDLEDFDHDDDYNTPDILDANALSSETLPKYSLTEPLPKGLLYQAIGRSRQTINLYVLGLTQVGWLATVVFPTLSALERRLRSHDHQVFGHVDPDIELGFRSLRVRVKNVMSVFKHIKRCIDNNDTRKLVPALPCFQILEQYLVV